MRPSVLHHDPLRRCLLYCCGVPQAREALQGNPGGEFLPRFLGRAIRLDSGRTPATLCAVMKRILVIDDDLGVRLFLTKLLETAGYEVVSADEAEAGLEAAWSQRPDLVITDFDMPVYNGLRAIRMFHADPSLQIPVIIVSGVADESVVEFGANAFFPKPVNSELLLAKVAELLSGVGPITGLPG